MRKAEIDIHLVDSQLQIINDEIKHELYAMMEEIRTFQYIFSEWEELTKVGRITHTYFDELITEFRSQILNGGTNQETIQVAKFPKLNDFLLPLDYSPGRRNIMEEYQKAKKLIMADILAAER